MFTVELLEILRVLKDIYCWIPFLTVLEVGGADGLVRDMISWMASRSFSLCRGLLMPISRCISVSDKADIIAPLFTFARQAATYQAGIPTQSWNTQKGNKQDLENISSSKSLNSFTSLYIEVFIFYWFGGTTYLQPHDHSRTIPLGKRQTLFSGFL